MIDLGNILVVYPALISAPGAFHHSYDPHDWAVCRAAEIGIRLEDHPNLRMKVLATAVASAHGISLAALRGPRRFKKLTRARQEFMWLARMLTEQSFPAIGRFLDGRDHTTVIFGARAHEARLAGDIAK